MNRLTGSELKKFLDDKAAKFNKVSFIKDDPISIPHQFKEKADIEISALFAAVLAWGQRKTIIAKSNELLERMDGKPYKFIMDYTDEGLKKLEGFKHRTFNDTDLLYFVDFLHRHYSKHDSLESAFIPEAGFESIENSLIHFQKYFFVFLH